MDGKKRLSARHCRSNGCVEVDTCKCSPWCACELCDLRKFAVVDCLDAAVTRGRNIVPVWRLRQLLHTALRITNTLKLPPCSSGCKNVRCHPQSAAQRRRTGQFQQMAGKSQCARPQSRAVQPDSFCSTASTSRASSAGPMPQPTGCVPSVSTISTVRSKAAATSFRRSGKSCSGLGIAQLRGRPDRQIEHNMS